jgi:hypothetical protein
MSAGCLPMLIQMPIIFGLIGVIYNPLTYALEIPKDIIAQLVVAAKELTDSPLKNERTIQRSSSAIFRTQKQHPDPVLTTLSTASTSTFSVCRWERLRPHTL